MCRACTAVVKVFTFYWLIQIDIKKSILYQFYIKPTYLLLFTFVFLGLDIPKHGEAAYPAEAYGHGWGEKGDSLAGLVKQAVRSTSVLANKGNDILLQRWAIIT